MPPLITAGTVRNGPLWRDSLQNIRVEEVAVKAADTIVEKAKTKATGKKPSISIATNAYELEITQDNYYTQ